MMSLFQHTACQFQIIHDSFFIIANLSIHVSNFWTLVTSALFIKADYQSVTFTCSQGGKGGQQGSAGGGQLPLQ